MLRIYLFFPTFTDQMENWGECGLWEFRVLATYGPNSQNSPSFSRIHLKKKKIGKSPLKIGFGNLGAIPPEGRISLRIYLSFLEFTKKICFYKICKFRHFFSYFTKTSEPHKKTGLVVVSSLFISDAFRL